MKNSTIAWTDHTFNPWEGCDKVSPGCANCYAAARDQRWHGGAHWGQGAPRRRTSEANWRQPLHWDRYAHAFFECNACGRREKRRWDGIGYSCCSTPGCLALPETEASRTRPRVFCASLADWLDEEVPIDWLIDLLDLIFVTQNLDWLLLTKRPENFRQRIEATRCFWWRDGYVPKNVWVGVTCENQEMADKRIPELLKIPAKVRFLSCEPLLLPVDITKFLKIRSNSYGVPIGQKLTREGSWVWTDEGSPMVSWVICGAESGPKRRVMDTAWAEHLMHQCSAAGVPFFMKQMSVNGKVTEDINQFPEHLRVREFPR